MKIVNGNVFCEDNIFRKVNIQIEDEIISGIGEFPFSGDGIDNPSISVGSDILDAEGCYVLPGLVEIHIHGAMGADFSDGDDYSIQTMAKFLLQKGITSFLGTSMALPEDRLLATYENAKSQINAEHTGRAVLRGINMEGPFFSQERRGAQNEKYIINSDIDMFNRLNDASGGNIKTVAVAPEIEGALDFISFVHDISNISIAHSDANYDVAMEAFSRGANHVTHLFNGMSTFSPRAPGIPGAAADADAYVELISDGVHLHPAVIRAVFKMFNNDRICLISDGMRALGMPDGEYDLGDNAVTVKGNRATIDSGSLAGSVTNLLDCFRHAVSFGIPIENAIKAATINPAKSVGLDDIVGSLKTGKRADIIILDKNLELKHVILGGEKQ